MVGAAESRSYTALTKIRMGRARDRVMCNASTVGAVGTGAERNKTDIMLVSLPTRHADEEPDDDTTIRAACKLVYRIKPSKAGDGAGQERSAADVTLACRSSASSARTTLELYTELDFKSRSTVVEYEKWRRPMTIRAVSQYVQPHPTSSRANSAH